MRRRNNGSDKSVKNARSIKRNGRRKPSQTPNSAAPSESTQTAGSSNNNAQNGGPGNGKRDPGDQWGLYLAQALKCYHADVPIDEIEYLLKEPGDYLFRRAEVNGKFEYFICVRHSNGIVHALMNRTSDGVFFIKKHTFNRPEDLLHFHIGNNLPVDDVSAYIKRPIEQQSHYLNAENIEVKQKIGEGAFGEVYEAVMRRIDGSFIKVACKNLKGFATKADRDEFMKEFRFMNQFEHENIVKIYGVTLHSTPILMVLEMCYGGSLKSYLKRNPLPYKHLIKYCTDAARGLCYLSTRDVIHRDIAARNCLLGGNDEVKISDFGLSVISKEPVKAGKNQKIAIRWCAPETISTGFFQMKTDVWAYGILMWEIFNHCHNDPFPGKTNAEVKTIITAGDKPLDLPNDVPSNVLKCYSYCLYKEASYRPNFIEILKFLSSREEPPIPEEMKKAMGVKTCKMNVKK
uniref:Tyrosine-protein kinase n=1 Tax=Strongyloides venezuelensis TaxID=75913 RepID=A0A0K0F5E2_STRVS